MSKPSVERHDYERIVTEYETHRQINAEIVALRRAVEQLQLEHLRIMRRIADLPSETGELKV
uniref:Uncharacterized protein n=1 Tax=viral metagenome TaxID=1070528 RepID=A0A6M3KJQ8_9ZZZZ